jgi:hypothetical protein
MSGGASDVARKFAATGWETAPNALLVAGQTNRGGVVNEKCCCWRRIICAVDVRGQVALPERKNANRLTTRAMPWSDLSSQSATYIAS